ncbi:MAG: alpha/beta hydrolase [Brucellaceae bacterium]|nr:alpha/beta hydrolase [Brucellaceae bacterium]
MTPDQIFAVIATLLAGNSDPDFERLNAGGYDSRYPVAVESCELPPATMDVEGHTVLCGTVTVPENYDKPDGRTIPLEFAILKSNSRSPAPDPLLYLHGGPGSGTLHILGPIANLAYANHRRTRDIITFDQRAAALSASTVVCYENMADHIVELVGVDEKKLPETTINAMVAPCVDEINASGADLEAYNTANNARDVRALMSALGHKTFNLYGISYGTRLTLEVLRQGPEGIRSAVIDGVASPIEKIYDELYTPYVDALDALVDQCASDAECNAAYPDLRSTINAAFDWLDKNGPIPAARGRPAFSDLDLYTIALGARNNWRDQRPITKYLPRIFEEASEGKSETYDALMTSQGPDRIAQLAGMAGLTEDERTLIRVALEIAEAMTDLDEGLHAAIERLKTDLAEDRSATSVAEAFEARSNQAAMAIQDENARAAMLRDYALLQIQKPSREALVEWVQEHFQGVDRDDLLTLIQAMSEGDIERTFAIADGQATKYENVLGHTINVAIYACQEDVPWNNRDGYVATIDKLAESYPVFAGLRQGTSFYDMCEAFDQHPREGFQTPIHSDVPVLVLNGLLDVQTSWKWGARAAETLSNSRNYIIPEAGHGSILYQPCANDISVAFINDPSAELDTSCIADIKIDFVMPDDPLPH